MQASPYPNGEYMPQHGYQGQGGPGSYHQGSPQASMHAPAPGQGYPGMQPGQGYSPQHHAAKHVEEAPLIDL